MVFSLQIADNNSQTEWDNYIQSSSHGTIFHTWQWLKIMEKNTDSTLYPIQIFKGSTHVANYPIFCKKTGFLRVALSPPYGTDVLYLGPVLTEYDSYKQHKKEDYLLGIQSEIDKFLFYELKCNYVNLRIAPGLYDSRPLRWAGYHVEPYYTYRIDLNADLEDIWMQLHKLVRKNIKNILEKGIVIEKGNKDDLLFIQSELKRRFIEQDKNKLDTSAFLDDIFNEFNGHNLDIFVAKYHGKTVSGAIYLTYNGVMYQWVGLSKVEIDGLSPNDLLVWESIRIAHENGLKYYDIMDGGDNPRLRRFKSKFNPDLCIWYSAEKYSRPAYEVGRNMCRKLGYHIKI